MMSAKVMVVEDERIVALNLKRKLINLGYQAPMFAASGEQALEKMQAVRPDIVLMDINIDGDMDGIETAARIPQQLRIPVIYLTAYSGDETLERARETRPYGYLLKPFSDRELHATIQMALERHQAEIALGKSEERLRLALEAAGMGTWELNTETRQLQCEGRSIQLFGAAESVFSGTWDVLLESIHPEDQAVVNKVLEWTLSDERLCQVEYRHLLPNGNFFWVRLLGKAFTMADAGRYVIGVAQDITEHKYTDALRLSKEAAEAASRAKSEFLANMSHEIRTPLNGVLGMVDLLQRTPLNDTQRSYAKTIQSSGKTLLAVINDILDFSKVEAGQMTLVEQPFDLAEMVDEITSPFRASSNNAVAFVASIAPETPNYLLGDATRLQQVIGNLLSNAFKFTPSGVVTLRIEPLVIEEERVQIHVRAIDTGIGISPSNLPRLFQPFSQVHDSNRRYGGSGLGLIICQRLVQMMGGEIQVDSSPGKGSVFFFSVWLRRNPEPITRSYNVDLTGKKLLAVDDCADYLQIITEQALSLGMHVAVIEQPALAIARASTLLPDIITIDLDMPDINGFELERQIAAVPVLAAIPRVLLTASSTPPSAYERSLSGFTGTHVKPTSATQLYEILAVALTGTQLSEEPQAAPSAPPYQGKTVLVAEDNAVNRQVITAMLQLLGVSVEYANDGAEAVSCVMHRATRYDAILMDCEMPNVDGYEATRAIRQHERAMGQSPTPIIALTAHALPEYQQRSRDAGMDDHLNKPISLVTLTDVLSRHIDRH